MYNNMPILSVVVPIHNMANYLSECIQSIINQTYKYLEIILVDDGSTDKSYDICNKYAEKDNRIKVFSKENGGPLSARLLGVENATAEYITFVDSDDWIDPQTYEIMVSKIVDSNTDFVAAGIIRYFSPQKMIFDINGIEPGFYNNEKYTDVICSHMICNGSYGNIGIDPSMANKIFKKELIYPLIKKAEKEYGQNYGEDAVVVYPYILKAESCIIIDNCMYYHRQHENYQTRYISDDDYDNILYKMYNYLNQFQNQINSEFFNRQLLYYFLLLYQRYYLYKLGNPQYTVISKNYLFPFNRVDISSKIVLYGAGSVGKIFYAQLLKTNYCQKIIWVDKNSSKNSMLRPVKKYEDVDYYIIAVERKTIAEEIKSDLISLGIDEKQIIWEDPFVKLW